MSRRKELAKERQRLQHRSAVLRERLAHHAQALEPGLSLVDRAREGVRWLRAHPTLVAGAAAALLVLRPRRALRWGLRAWGGWRLLARARSVVERFQQSL